MRLRLQPKLVYDYLCLRLRSGEAPTLRELGDHFHRCPASIHEILVKLENRGLIERTRKWRGITLTYRA